MIVPALRRYTVRPQEMRSKIPLWRTCFGRRPPRAPGVYNHRKKAAIFASFVFATILANIGFQIHLLLYAGTQVTLPQIQTRKLKSSTPGLNMTKTPTLLNLSEEPLVAPKVSEVPPVPSKVSEVPPRDIFPKQPVSEGNWVSTDLSPVTRAKVFLYSAYSEDRLSRPAVLVIGAYATRGGTALSYWLQFSDGNVTVGNAEKRSSSEHWNLKYTATFFTCFYTKSDNYSRPVRIRLKETSQPCWSPAISVRSRGPVPGHPKGKLAVCVKPLHYSYDRALWFAEFVEFHWMLGVEHFFFYNHSIGPNVERLIGHYTARGLATVLPWTLEIRSWQPLVAELPANVMSKPRPHSSPEHAHTRTHTLQRRPGFTFRHRGTLSLDRPRRGGHDKGSIVRPGDDVDWDRDDPSIRRRNGAGKGLAGLSRMSYAMPDYLSLLPEPEGQRYRDKLCVDGVAFDDPYAVNKACWTSDVKLLPPNERIESQKEIRTEGIFASLNDCVYRCQHHFEHVLNLDLDEFVVPRGEDSLADLVAKIRVKHAGAKALVVRNTFFYLYWNNDTRAYGALPEEASPRQLPYLLTQYKTRRSWRIFWPGTRSKYIVDPMSAIEVNDGKASADPISRSSGHIPLGIRRRRNPVRIECSIPDLVN
ncbi:hypothetical protein HPB47_002667 [Ixodes persulcatus]|uniref:Uncharacterized protein n=1 Tax=Ixodes persulcatus TaxID=34615 RepID=A0AC60PKW5_IXOPE|nr:hypothetical protein HPB47_002667 [Ixodes persulcatus]